MPVIQSTLVTLASSIICGCCRRIIGQPEPLIDSQRPLKRRLDLAAENATPSQPLHGASCAMPMLTVTAAMDTTFQSKGFNKREKMIYALVASDHVYIELSDDDGKHLTH